MAARVEDIDAIKQMRVSLIKYCESVSVALASADSDVMRIQSWLANEQVPFWTTQIRKRAELLSRAQEALRHKLLYPDATGRPQSVVDEQKAVKKAKAMLEEAEQKLIATKAYVRKIEQKQNDYRGSVQRLATQVQSMLPDAAVKLGNLVTTLERYAAVDQPTEAASMAVAPDEAVSKDVEEESP